MILLKCAENTMVNLDHVDVIRIDKTGDNDYGIYAFIGDKAYPVYGYYPTYDSCIGDYKKLMEALKKRIDISVQIP